MDEISFKEKLSFGIGAYGKDLVYGIVATFLMVFYTDVVGVSPVFIGGLFLVARIWDAFNDPMMGWIVDNTKTKYGKFRPWILGGTVINSIVLVLLYTNPSTFLQGTMVYVWCAVTYVLWGMTYTLMDVPYWSMIPSFSNDSKVRDTMSVIPRLFAMFGGQTIGTFGLMIVAFLGVNMGATDTEGYFRFALAVAVLFNICEVICFLNVKEHVVVERKESIKLSEAFQILKNNDQLLVIIGLTILQQLGVYLFLGLNVYFFKYVVCNESWFAIFGGVSFATQLVAFALFPKLVRVFNHRIIYLASYTLLIIGCLLMFVTGTDSSASMYVFFPCAAIFQIGNALTVVSTTVMLANTCDYGEYKCGIRSEALVFSSQTLTVKFGSAVAGAIGGIMLEAVGYVPNVVQTAETIMGLRCVMFLMSAAIFLVIILAYLKFYRLTGDYYRGIVAELKELRKAAAANA